MKTQQELTQEFFEQMDRKPPENINDYSIILTTDYVGKRAKLEALDRIVKAHYEKEVLPILEEFYIWTKYKDTVFAVKTKILIDKIKN